MATYGYLYRCTGCKRDWPPAQVNTDGSCARCDCPTEPVRVSANSVPDTVPVEWSEPSGYQGPPLSC